VPTESSTKLTGLVALQAIKNDGLTGEKLPTRLKLLDWGDNATVSKGTVKVGPGTVRALAANQARLGFDVIALDYAHNSLPGHPNFARDPRKVAAYGKPVVIEGEGLFLEALSFTPSGKEHAREYHDLSPTPLLDEQGEVTFLHSVALCPQGEVQGLSFFSADFLTALSTDPKNKPSMDFKKLLITLLGLKDDASDADIEAACKSFAEKGEAKEEAKPADAVAMAALGKLIENQGKALTALTTKLEAQDREALSAAALREGKIVPLSAKNLAFADFKALLAELPANQVPLDQRTPEGLTALAATGLTSTADDTIRVNLGISKDTWDKYAKA
jgi:phage I-like protein